MSHLSHQVFAIKIQSDKDLGLHIFDVSNGQKILDKLSPYHKLAPDAFVDPVSSRRCKSMYHQAFERFLTD